MFKTCDLLSSHINQSLHFMSHFSLENLNFEISPVFKILILILREREIQQMVVGLHGSGDEGLDTVSFFYCFAPARLLSALGSGWQCSSNRWWRVTTWSLPTTQTVYGGDGFHEFCQVGSLFGSCRWFRSVERFWWVQCTNIKILLKMIFASSKYSASLSLSYNM